MPLFRCEKCGCVENTATSNYWNNEEPKFCSECDPAIGRWHGLFEKRSAKGFLLGSDGFLYSKEEIESGNDDWRMKSQGFFIKCVIE